MIKYAQIDSQGYCVGVSFLASEVDAPHLIPLRPDDDVQPGDVWDGVEWTRPVPEPLPPPAPSRIEQLETQLALMQAALDDIILGGGA